MMSSRARRMAAHHERHRAGGAEQLNLIPLIDILSTLVAFLLVYSTDVEVIQNSKGIPIPQSISRDLPHHSVVVMVTREDVFVQGERVAAVADVRPSQRDLMPLLQALRRPLLAGRDSVQADPANREVTIMADKALPYEVIKSIMNTCTDADYGKVSLAVLQKDQPVPAGQVAGA
ncbi:MAG TPA: biopolymer transporter ExbD [Steroidobacteraceae bacterium]|nr:biopolymer transporter ExbD [Steroidobacteraceae bacterium]